MINASVYILAYNGERTIENTLKCVAGKFSEIIVVESFSQDKTLEIIKKFDCKLMQNKFINFADQRQFALNLCQNNWVLQLDQDEVISDEALEKIKSVVEKNENIALSVKLTEYFIDSFTSDDGLDKVVLFKKDKSFYDPKITVHESITTEYPIFKSKVKFYHYSTVNIEDYVRKINLYSSMKAKRKFDAGKKASNLKMFSIFFLILIKTLILKRLIFAGKNMIILSFLNAFYSFLSEAKLYELNKLAKKTK